MIEPAPETCYRYAIQEDGTVLVSNGDRVLRCEWDDLQLALWRVRFRRGGVAAKDGEMDAAEVAECLWTMGAGATRRYEGYVRLMADLNALAEHEARLRRRIHGETE